MKKVAKRLLLLAVLAALFWTFRGPIYRYAVHYQVVSPRRTYLATAPVLIAQFEKLTNDKKPVSVTERIARTQTLTAEHLHFSAARGVAADPNRLVETRAANCIGYAAYFAAAFNFLQNRSSDPAPWEAEPHVAKLYFFNHNVHKVLQSGFWRDHDIVVIKNAQTGEEMAVDPSLYDYTGIKAVRVR